MIKITLEQNFQKLKNCLMSVQQLTSDDLSYANSVSQRRCNQRKRIYLYKTLKNIKRLNKVINKQIFESGMMYKFYYEKLK